MTGRQHRELYQDIRPSLIPRSQEIGVPAAMQQPSRKWKHIYIYMNCSTCATGGNRLILAAEGSHIFQICPEMCHHFPLQSDKQLCMTERFIDAKFRGIVTERKFENSPTDADMGEKRQAVGPSFFHVGWLMFCKCRTHRVKDRL